MRDFALPKRAYVPGKTPRHAEGFLDYIVDQALPKTLDQTALANPAWCFGLHLLSEEFYWEAHEVLEKVWLNAAPNSRERQLVQGVIHIANAALKVRMERPTAAARLCALAGQCIEEAFNGYSESTLMALDQEQIMDMAKNASRPKFVFKTAIL